MNRFPVPGFLSSMFDRDRSTVERIHAMRAEFGRLSDIELRATASKAEDLPRWIALAATAALRVLGQDMYDVQLRGALALARGAIAEMQTGEGKTLAAVPAICWFAREHRGVHVMTVNDYLARRDAAWMGGIYRLLGLTGYARLDYRLTDKRRLYLLEANPNPQIAKNEDFADSAEHVGIEYEELLQKLITLGLSYEPRPS